MLHETRKPLRYKGLRVFCFCAGAQKEISSKEGGQKSEKTKAGIGFDFLFVWAFLGLESGISHALTVQCHCKDSAAFSGNHFPGVDRGFPTGGRNLQGSSFAGAGAGGKHFFSDNNKYMDSEKADAIAERFQELFEL